MLIERVHKNKDITDCHKNLYAFWKVMAIANAKAIIENDRFLFIPTKITNPILNPVLCFPSFCSNTNAVIQELIKKVGTNNKISWWHDSSMHDIQTLDVLKKQYVSQFGPIPIMQYDLTKNLPTQNKYIVDVWPDPKNIDDIMALVGVCFNLEEEDLKIYQRATEMHHVKFKHFLIRINSKIVGVGSLFFDDESVGSYNLAVLPEFRNQGIATAIHIARFHTAREMNYRTVSLQATPMAIDLDLSIGFKSICELNIFW